MVHGSGQQWPNIRGKHFLPAEEWNGLGFLFLFLLPVLIYVVSLEASFAVASMTADSPWRKGHRRLR